MDHIKEWAGFHFHVMLVTIKEQASLEIISDDASVIPLLPTPSLGQRTCKDEGDYLHVH